MRRLATWLSAMAFSAALGASASAHAEGYEVWLVDQSDTASGHGGRIHIYDGAHVSGENVSAAQPSSVIDLAGATAALCRTQTGANPVRPHMILFNSTHSHGVLAFVASGHVVIFDAKTRTPVSCIRTSVGAGGARQAHAAFPSYDDTYILVANQNGKLLERINTNYATGTFTLDSSATLNLATCTTPTGALCQDTALRPDNAPICPIIDSTSNLGFVTLRGGGLFVVNPRTSPMSIVGEYTKAKVVGNGCGGIEAGGSMFMNSGAGAPGPLGNPDQFDVYRFPLVGYSAANPVNTPAPLSIFSDPSEHRDAHGMVVSKHGRYLWVFDRLANVAEIFDTATNAKVHTQNLVSTHSADPTPDLGDLSPSGNRLFVSTRGPNPLSGGTHVAVGDAPGLMVIQMEEGGKRGTVKGIARISNIDGSGVERADAHGVRVRLK